MKILEVPEKFKMNYEDINKLAPDEYPVVSVFNKETNEYFDKQIFRKYISYGVSPKFKNTGKSYMFNNKGEGVPKELESSLEFARTVYPDTNNVYVNWYKDGEDHIEPHSDCVSSLRKGSPIIIVNLNEGEFERSFIVQSKSDPKDISRFSLRDRMVIVLDAHKQVDYRHWIGREDTKEGRISISFRTVNE